MMLDDATARILQTEPTEGGSLNGPEVHQKNLNIMPGTNSELQSTEQNATAAPAHKEDNHMEDFAAALESYTLETEPAPSEDNVFKGTVVKITATHVVVDIGFKSEGLVPIAEVTDSEGQIK